MAWFTSDASFIKCSEYLIFISIKFAAFENRPPIQHNFIWAQCRLMPCPVLHLIEEFILSHLMCQLILVLPPLAAFILRIKFFVPHSHNYLAHLLRFYPTLSQLSLTIPKLQCSIIVNWLDWDLRNFFLRVLAELELDYSRVHQENKQLLLLPS
jgi:hypothetical protein